MSSFGSRGAGGTGAGEGAGFAVGSTFAVVCVDGVAFALGDVFAVGAVTGAAAAPASASRLTGSAGGFAIAAAVFSRVVGPGVAVAGAVGGAPLAAASLRFGHATKVAITASVTSALATRKRFFVREGAVVVAVAIGVV